MATATPAAGNKARSAVENAKAAAAALQKARRTPTPESQARHPAKAWNIGVTDNFDPKGGFKSFQHFCQEVRSSSRGPRTKSMADWITKADASGLGETVGSEGGFLVPPEFSNELMMRTYDNDLLSRCRSYTASGNTLSIPAIDETSRVDGSRFGGVRAYWESEAGQFTSSQPAYNRVELKLKKLVALCYVTDELLQDAAIALEQHLMDLFAQEIAFKTGDSIIRGTGTGMPRGVLKIGRAHV